MSILIKGMTMPKNCHECPLFESKYHCHGCHVVPKSFDDMDMWNFVGDRPSWCPLVELPPHGDLIDRKALSMTDFEIATCTLAKGNPYKNGLEYLLNKIDDAPTIIESEGEDG